MVDILVNRFIMVSVPGLIIHWIAGVTIENLWSSKATVPSYASRPVLVFLALALIRLNFYFYPHL